MDLECAPRFKIFLLRLLAGVASSADIAARGASILDNHLDSPCG